MFVEGDVTKAQDSGVLQRKFINRDVANAGQLMDSLLTFHHGKSGRLFGGALFIGRREQVFLGEPGGAVEGLVFL